MRYGFLCFWAVILLLLGGCTPMPEALAGPQGGGAPLPLQDNEPAPRAVLPQRPMRRQRRNAALGRSVTPQENAACGACGGGACDYPLWLQIAQKQSGLYMSYDRSAAAGEQEAYAPRLPLLFSPVAAGYDEALSPAARPRLPESRGAAAPYEPESERVWSSLFVNWCLAQARNPETGRPYAPVLPGPAAETDWLHYGVPAEPCLGALMAAAQQEDYSFAFCLGALSLPLDETMPAARAGTIYLGLGVKQGGSLPGRRIGLVAFAAADIIACRLPQHYHPCKEHFKLEHTVWAEQVRDKMRLRHRQQQKIMAAAPPAAAYAPRFAAAAVRQDSAAYRPDGKPAYAPAIAAAAQEQTPDQELQAAIERELQKQDWGGAEAGPAAGEYGGQAWHGLAARPDFGRVAAPVMSK